METHVVILSGTVKGGHQVRQALGPFTESRALEIAARNEASPDFDGQAVVWELCSPQFAWDAWREISNAPEEPDEETAVEAVGLIRDGSRS